jgi:Uma2 family endonuclease
MTIEKTLNPIELYYQEYPEEREMSEGYLHRDLTEYLRDLLRWYYRSQPCLITANLVVYDAQHKTCPDIAVIKEVQLSKQEQQELLGWEVKPPERLAPGMVLEISSKENWEKDLDPDKNQQKYGQLGVKEYFAFDPLGYWREVTRLKGWRYEAGQAFEITSQESGWLWSEELGLWLVVEGAELKLYDQRKQLLLNEAQTERLATRIERQKADAFQAELEALRDKLRARNLDPDQL